MMRVLLPLPAHGLAELAHALAQGAGHFGQALGAEDDKGNDGDEEDVDGVLDAYTFRLALCSTEAARSDPQASPLEKRAAPGPPGAPSDPSGPPPSL